MSAINDFFKETSGKTYTITELAPLVREALVGFCAEIIGDAVAGINIQQEKPEYFVEFEGLPDDECTINIPAGSVVWYYPDSCFYVVDSEFLAVVEARGSTNHDNIRRITKVKDGVSIYAIKGGCLLCSQLQEINNERTQ